MTWRFLMTAVLFIVPSGVVEPAFAQSAGEPERSPASQAKSKTAAARSEPAQGDQDRNRKQNRDQNRSQTDDQGNDSPTRNRLPLEKATFGGGCFWCLEAVFERLPGVKSVVSGYAGGHVPNPTYQMVCTGLTGHAEVIQIEYDPQALSFEKLLDLFWSAHDPTTLNRQDDDYGPQYRSIILYHSEKQKEAAQKSFRDLTSRRVFRSPIVTELVPFTEFYPAEPYHQDYFRNNPYADYSQFYIVPKLKKLKNKLK